MAECTEREAEATEPFHVTVGQEAAEPLNTDVPFSVCCL